MSVPPDVAANLVGRVNVGDMLTRTAGRHPANEAIVAGDVRISYERFEARANGMAHALLERGFAPGDRIGIISTNTPEFLISYYAFAKLGITSVPINLGWDAQLAAYVLEHSEAVAVVVAGNVLDYAVEILGREEVARVREVFVAEPRGDFRPAGALADRFVAFEDLTGASTPPAVALDDRAELQLLYTSGTTARPKGVVGSHLAGYLNALGLCVDWEFRSSDRIVSMMPLFHTAQLNLFSTPAVAVGATILLEDGFEPERILAVTERERGTVLFGLPMMYQQMLDSLESTPRDVASLRLAVYGMAPMPDSQLRRAIEVFGCDFSLMFGQTEMGPVTTIFRPEHQLLHPGSIGTPSINTQVAVMDDEGGLVADGGLGEIVYRSPQVLTEYLKDPEATAQSLRHGWFHSGDVGRIDEHGMLWFEDRSKDVIKTGGENVASLEVEKALYEANPAVAQAAVVGLPHEHWSEAITGFVVVKPGAEAGADEILVSARKILPGFKAPKKIVLLTELPMTSSGKIQKHLLRSEYSDLYRDEAT